MITRLEFVGGTSNKFWEIQVTGAAHSVRFGRNGSTGQTKIRHFPTSDAAALDAAKLIQDKLDKGYHAVDVTGAQQNIQSVASPKLSTATRFILTIPNREVASFIVIQAGNRIVTNRTVQEFPSVAAATEHLERVISFRKKDGYVLQSTEAVSEDEIVPALADDKVEVKKENERIAITFHEDASRDDCSKLIRQLESDAPRTVQLICDFTCPGVHWEKAIAGRRLCSVTSFIFDTHFQTQTRQRENSLGNIAVSLGSLPAVERVFATGKLSLTACKHEGLRELHLLGDPLSKASLKGLAESEFPQLERLVLSLASDAEPVPCRYAISALLELQAPNLREVHIDSLDNVAATLAMLTKAGPPNSLKLLGLSGYVDEDSLLATIRAGTSRLRQLQTLALPLGDELSSEGEETARELLANLCDTSEFRRLTLPDAYKDW